MSQGILDGSVDLGRVHGNQDIEETINNSFWNGLKSKQYTPVISQMVETVMASAQARLALCKRVIAWRKSPLLVRMSKSKA
jgi:hypothetical protein